MIAFHFFFLFKRALWCHMDGFKRSSLLNAYHLFSSIFSDFDIQLLYNLKKPTRIVNVFLWGEKKKNFFFSKLLMTLVIFKHKRQWSQSCDRMDYEWGCRHNFSGDLCRWYKPSPYWGSLNVILSRGSKIFSECCRDSLRMHKHMSRW